MRKKVAEVQMNRREQIDAVLKLSHKLADPHHPMAILGEGNTSCRISQKTFLVKASGSTLGTLSEKDLVECRFEVLLPLLEGKKMEDAEVDSALMESRVDSSAKKPSVEALFHAWLLEMPEVNFVAHTHAPAVNSILCSTRAGEFARKRIFPDEIVCCDVESVLAPYTDPGLKLAKSIRSGVCAFMEKHKRVPRVILLQNHGLITVGRTAEGALAAMQMAEKAATIWLGAAALGGPVFLSSENVARISGRPDEALRRKMLKI